MTIADDFTYNQLNSQLEAKLNQIKEVEKKTLFGKNFCLESEQCKKDIVKWVFYVYNKLLSEQIFVPLETADNREVMYAPFHTLAHYYHSLGYSGIIYGSTVSTVGKNIVLFNKKMAHPVGEIKMYII